MCINVIAATDCLVDVIFIVDESLSVRTSNYDLMKSFVSQLVGRLDIDNGDTRVGLVTYAEVVNTAQAFNLSAHMSVASVQAAISSLTYTGSVTVTHLALAYVRTTMLTLAAGDRPGVPNVVVIMTDGSSYNATATQVCTT